MYWLVFPDLPMHWRQSQQKEKIPIFNFLFQFYFNPHLPDKIFLKKRAKIFTKHFSNFSLSFRLSGQLYFISLQPINWIWGKSEDLFINTQWFKCPNPVSLSQIMFIQNDILKYYDCNFIQTQYIFDINCDHH